MHHFSTATVAKWSWHILRHITLVAVNNVVVLVVFPPLADFLFCPFCLIFVCRTANFLIYAIQGRFTNFYTNFVVQTLLAMHNHSPFGGCGIGIQCVTSEIYCSVAGFTQPFFSILATIGINLENGFLFARPHIRQPPAVCP